MSEEIQEDRNLPAASSSFFIVKDLLSASRAATTAFIKPLNVLISIDKFDISCLLSCAFVRISFSVYSL